VSPLAITGASGFIGRTLLAALPAQQFTELRVLVHDKPALEFPAERRVIKVNADLLDPATLRELVVPGSTVVHLAYIATARPEEDNLMAARNLLAACREAGIRRLIYCSTAVVAGNVHCDVVNETTECRLANGYEAAKFAVERLVLQELRHGIEVAVLRPTAVFGPGGRNLVRLAQDLLRLNGIVNYAKSCLQGRRRMNLVHVDNVVAALSFLIDVRHDVGGEVYIVSDDESPLNNYQDVERHLFQGLGIRYYPVPPVALPRAALSVALKMAGRTNTNPDRIYDGSKLIKAGLKKPMPFERGLVSFASWYRSLTRTQGGRAS
jgi:nucleoside-diphosphate-sugar epimerase